MFPSIHLIGWCWGHEAQQKHHIDDPTGRRPAYFIKQNNPILKPMHLLRAHLHGAGAR